MAQPLLPYTNCVAVTYIQFFRKSNLYFCQLWTFNYHDLIFFFILFYRSRWICRVAKTLKMTTKLHKVIPKVNEGIEYMKVCTDFCTDETFTNISKIKAGIKVAKAGSTRKDRTALGKHVTESDFGLLFPKMWTLTECLDHYTPDEGRFLNCRTVKLFKPRQSKCQGLINLKKTLDFAASLGKCGAIKLLFEGLKKTMAMKSQFPDSKHLLCPYILRMFAILHNSIRHCSSNLTFYRNSNAVPILKGFLQQDESVLQIFSLLILAYVVTDEESEMFGSEEIGVRILTVFFIDAVKSSNHSKHLLGLVFSTYELLDAINHLARNDANKKAVSSTGAISYIIQMLQKDFTPEEQQVAAEALWNLSFIPEIRKSDELQKAIPCKFCKSSQSCYYLIKDTVACYEFTYYIYAVDINFYNLLVLIWSIYWYDIGQVLATNMFQDKTAKIQIKYLFPCICNIDAVDQFERENFEEPVLWTLWDNHCWQRCCWFTIGTSPLYNTRKP